MTFKNKLLLCLMLMMGLLIAVWWCVVEPRMVGLLREEVAQRAMVQSRQIAQLEELHELVKANHVEGVTTFVDGLYQVSDADFIVVSDINGMRLAHPKPERIGQQVMGGDIDAALQEGLHYLSEGVGSLGRSLRYISPLIDRSGNVIGMVKVGYLVGTLSEWRRLHLAPIMVMAISGILLAIVAAYWFSYWVRRSMQGLEPEQLLQLLKVHQTVLQSTHEGLIAIDGKGCTIAINQTACNWLALDASNIKGKQIEQFIDSNGFCAPDSADLIDDMAQFNQLPVVASRVALKLPDGGVVISFRRRDELSLLAQQLSQIKQHTESLRIMRHEYANQLSTLGGLIQMGALDKALAVINQQTENQQKIIDTIKEICGIDQLSGLLIGKYHRAQELRISLEFAPQCHLFTLPDNLSESELSAILGNLIDNSFDACLPGEGKVSIFFSDEGPELSIVVTDNGQGIDPMLCEKMFDWGVSKKSEEGHGIGLYLVQRYVTQAGGYVELDTEKGMTTFSIYIPKSFSLV